MNKFKFKFTRIIVEPEARQRLVQMQPGTSHLLMCNHINFTDPHVLFALCNRHGKQAYWIAGVEPFEKDWLTASHIRSVGCLSLDRGILDKRALQYFQQRLNEAQYPCVIFPEGEARYVSKTLTGFNTGAVMLAVAAATHRQDGQPHPALIWPVTITHQFLTCPAPALVEDCTRLAADMGQAGLSTVAGLHRLDVDALPEGLYSVLHSLVAAFVACLSSQYGVAFDANTDGQQESLENAIIRLQLAIAGCLCAEHAPEITLDAATIADYGFMMNLKNKLRSLIIRKIDAPSPARLEQHQRWLKQAAEGNTRVLRRLERTLFDMGYEAVDTVPKRVARVEAHLAQMVPYVSARVEASAQTLARWHDQLNVTRQLKMLTLIAADLQKADKSWQGLDELLVKLEIAALSRFVYRGPKEVRVHVAEPIDVTATMAEQTQAGMPRKAIIRHLNEQVWQQMAHRLTTIYGQPKTNQPEPVLSD
ncbi:MAG: 1-acyl-sn-glycerol-3-phosphate acyltransferase [Vampirovibrionales bacterium]